MIPACGGGRCAAAWIRISHENCSLSVSLARATGGVLCVTPVCIQTPTLYSNYDYDYESDLDEYWYDEYYNEEYHNDEYIMYVEYHNRQIKMQTC